MIELNQPLRFIDQDCGRPKGGHGDEGVMSGARNQQTGQAGQHFVAAEILRRGGYAVTFAGNMPGIDIIATDLSTSRTITIQVKTKNSGTWHTSGSHGAKGSEASADSSFWVFVDLEKDPVYYIVPGWWIRNSIWQIHTTYLAEYEQRHGVPRKSDHHGIDAQRLERWRGRWDVLGIFGEM